MSARTGSRPVIALGVVVAALVAGAAPAQAGQLYVGTETTRHATKPKLVYVGGAGERNDVTVRVEEHLPGPGQLTRTAIVTDPVGVTAGAGCSARPNDPTTATCDVTEHWRFHSFEAVLGDGDDRAAVGTELFELTVLRGQGGDDRLSGSAIGRNLLVGGSGNDHMVGGAQSDIFAEGSRRNGSDVILARNGRAPNTQWTDWVDYSDRRRPVLADTVGDRDDGERGERDKLVDVEALVGGAGADRLTGSSTGDYLVGGTGGDVLEGSGGDDYLIARWRPPGFSPRRRPARGPKDRLAGGSGDDAIYADGGGDTLVGGQGVDKLVGGGGADRILSADRTTDEIDCDGGRDLLRQDRLDIHVSCERRRRQSRAAIPLTATAYQDKFGSPYVYLRVGCPAVGSGRCSGMVRFTDGGRVLYEFPFERDLSGLGEDFVASDELWQRLHDGDPQITVAVTTAGVRGRPVAVPAARLREAPSLGPYYIPAELPVGD